MNIHWRILLVTVPGFDSRTCQVDWCRLCRCSFYHFLSWDTQRNLFRGTLGGVKGPWTLSSIPFGGVPQHRWTVVTPGGTVLFYLWPTHIQLSIKQTLFCLFVCWLVCAIRIRTCPCDIQVFLAIFWFAGWIRVFFWISAFLPLDLANLNQAHDRCLKKHAIGGNTVIHMFVSFSKCLQNGPH